MKYLWTEDSGAGFHYWRLVNEYLFDSTLTVESKGSNQGLRDAVIDLHPAKEDIYYIAFDIVYDNQDVMIKYRDLLECTYKYPEQIVLLDITCFEYLILKFQYLLKWTGTGKKDKIVIRQQILDAMKGHKIDVDSIQDKKTKNYLDGFKKYSTERVLKSLTWELTEIDEWSVKGEKMGKCWLENCCIKDGEKTFCKIGERMSGNEKILTLLKDEEIQRIIKCIYEKIEINEALKALDNSQYSEEGKKCRQ